MQLQKNMTLTWSDPNNQKSWLNKSQKFIRRTKNVVSSVSNNLRLSNYPLNTWEFNTVSSFHNKLIASIRPNWSFTYKRKSKLAWCASSATTKGPKTLLQEKPLENICSQKIIHLWIPKKVSKSTKITTISPHFSNKSLRSKKLMQTLLALLSKRWKLLLTTKKKLNKRKKGKIKKWSLKVKKQMENGMMSIVKYKVMNNGKMNLNRILTKLSKSKTKNKMKMKMNNKWRKRREEK